MYTFSPDICHEEYLIKHPPLLAFDPQRDYTSWKSEVKETFVRLLGDEPERVDPNLCIEWERETEEYTERRIVYDVERDASVPAHLLIPKKGKAPYPLVICLQGHTTGMHISLGRTLYEGDGRYLENDADYGLQAVKQGYAVLCIEQRGFGERKCNRDKYLWKSTTCEHAAMVALLMGRTFLRERAWDVQRAIDFLPEFPEIDMEHIAIMGNSGGGTATYYTACLEPRIRTVMPSCSVCSFDRSIVMRRHCDCNYVPGMLKYMDMGEMACMIAPRPLIIVAGEEDDGFRIDGVEKVFRVISEIYKKEGAPENCKLIKGPAGHRFYADLSWDTFREMFIG